MIQIIEIKKPNHGLENIELDRINKYIDLMEEFLQAPGNEEFLEQFRDFHVTLVCDSIKLKDVAATAFKGLKNEGRLTHITWDVFLLRTKKMHEQFLQEKERQQDDAPKQ